MRSGIVRVRNRVAGRLVEDKNSYLFLYDDAYLKTPETPPVSLTLPKQPGPHRSDFLFPFFCGLLAEGALKTEQCRRLKLDEDDDFGRLLLTAGADTIGAVTVHPESR
jgi:HipA-like protein